MRAAGKEGIMLNVADGLYVCKRTSDLLKVKVFQDCDLQIIGFQQGSGKFANTLGALIVDYKGNQVGVGSGISDDIRKEIWDHQDQYLGRVVTVQYFEETCDATGKLSIRFPVFKEIREIGKEISYN
jgi:DNA ligase-1